MGEVRALMGTPEFTLAAITLAATILGLLQKVYTAAIVRHIDASKQHDLIVQLATVPQVLRAQDEQLAKIVQEQTDHAADDTRRFNRIETQMAGSEKQFTEILSRLERGNGRA